MAVEADPAAAEGTEAVQAKPAGAAGEAGAVADVDAALPAAPVIQQWMLFPITQVRRRRPDIAKSLSGAGCLCAQEKSQALRCFVNSHATGYMAVQHSASVICHGCSLQPYRMWGAQSSFATQ